MWYYMPDVVIGVTIVLRLYYDEYYVWYYERTPYYLFYAYYASVIEMYYDCITVLRKTVVIGRNTRVIRRNTVLDNKLPHFG